MVTNRHAISVGAGIFVVALLGSVSPTRADGPPADVAKAERLKERDRLAAETQRLRDEGIESTVVEVNVRYLAPARFDERLTVQARCVDRKRVSFRFEYLIERDGTPIAEGWSVHSIVDARTLRPVRMPAWLEQAMEAAEAASPTT